MDSSGLQVRLFWLRVATKQEAGLRTDSGLVWAKALTAAGH